MEISSLKKIRALNGLEQFKKLMEDWYLIYKNKQKFLNTRSITLPNLLFVTSPGSGLIMITDLICEFLEETHLFEFVGSRKYFRHFLDRSLEKSVFPSFARLVEEIQVSAGIYQHTFRGLILIDISDWQNHLLDLKFQRFLKFVNDTSENILFIFTIPITEELNIRQIESTLMYHTQLRKININYPDNDNLCEYVEDYLRDNGFLLGQGTYEFIKSSIKAARQLEGFNGYKTLEILAKEIIYEKSKSSVFRNFIITESDLEFLNPNGRWINQLKRIKLTKDTYENIQKLKFGGKTDDGVQK